MRRLFIAAAAIAATAFPARADLQITVDKTSQTLTVARDGQVLHRWPVSTGRTGRFTPSGKFRAFRMEKDHFSREFDDAPMPHSIFFTQRGHAIHGSYETNKLGRPASGGCVRLAPQNAKILFDLVKAEGVLKTTVRVDGDERIAIARARQESAQAGRRTAPRDDEPRRSHAAPRGERPVVEAQPRGYYYDGHGWRAYGSSYYGTGGRTDYDYAPRHAPPGYYYPRRYDELD